jgi:hypothetical protein
MTGLLENRLASHSTRWELFLFLSLLESIGRKERKMSFGELSTEITSTASAKSLFRVVFLFSPSIPHRNPRTRACTRTRSPAASHFACPAPTLQASAPARAGWTGQERTSPPVDAPGCTAGAKPGCAARTQELAHPGARAARSRPRRSSGRALADKMMMPGPFFLTG